MKKDSSSRVMRQTPVGAGFAVATVEGLKDSFMTRPCAECPWRKDSRPGDFPPDAFRHSAYTAYDAATATFACHMSGTAHPATCAGFLLSNADNNLSVRIATITGSYDASGVRSDVDLYGSYREMAEANGVDPDDPSLASCRANWEEGERGV